MERSCQRDNIADVRQLVAVSALPALHLAAADAEQLGEVVAAPAEDDPAIVAPSAQHAQTFFICKLSANRHSHHLKAIIPCCPSGDKERRKNICVQSRRGTGRGLASDSGLILPVFVGCGFRVEGGVESQASTPEDQQKHNDYLKKSYKPVKFMLHGSLLSANYTDPGMAALPSSVDWVRVLGYGR